MCSDSNRLCSLPPAVWRQSPTRASSASWGGGGAGSNSFQSYHHGAQFGRRHGKLRRPSNPGLSGRHSQRHRRTEMESRIHQSGLHCGRGSASDRAAAGECGAGCVELRGPGRDLRGCAGGFGSGAMPLLPVHMLSEQPSPRFLLGAGLASVCVRDPLCTLFLRAHQTPWLPWRNQPHRFHLVLLCGGRCPHPARYASHKHTHLHADIQKQPCESLEWKIMIKKGFGLSGCFVLECFSVSCPL